MKAQLERLYSKIGEFDLPASGAWPKTRHCLDADVANAIAAAVLSKRPLLVRGEPGVGKSQLARAAAHALQRRFIATVIQPDSEYQDLLWSTDHTQRLAEAQLGERDRVNDIVNFISPGPLWWALNWETAEGQAKKCSISFRPSADHNAPDAKKQGTVLLVDEVDKADISLANGLLEVLGNRSFDIAPLDETVKPVPMNPLVVLTSNDTRELPAALIRRCVVLDMKLPDDLHGHLVKMGRTHHGTKIHEEVLILAADEILADRADCHELPKTGLAEYLDLLAALHEAEDSEEGQKDWLKKLGKFFRKSHAVER